ncbi:MAG: T9SS type A sorting domain-containing protein [Prolixibacteraceae bacterium]|nr:T9SS type A sorting domain-containing protein [Prolixibacteraceae bacterium]
MKKIYSLLIALLVCGSLIAQTATGDNLMVKYTPEPVEIDGYIEELWDAVEAVPCDQRFFREEVPTVEGTYFKVLYDDDYCYVLIECFDQGNHWPSWESGGNSWEYDKPEVYWDVNENLMDGVGVSAAGSGHWQIAEGFADGSYDVPIEVAGTEQNPGGIICYSLAGEDYVYEHAVPWANMHNADGVYLDVNMAKDLVDIGFDVTIIDQDEGITTVRQRSVWMSSGNDGGDENWNTMDGAGTITLEAGSSPKSVKNLSMNVYPNPASSTVTISANFNRVVISNILGQEVKSINSSSRTLNVSDLSKGVYVIKAYNNDKYVGTAKLTKN